MERRSAPLSPSNMIPLSQVESVRPWRFRTCSRCQTHPGSSTTTSFPPTKLEAHDQWSFKLDHSISSTIKLSWYYSRLESNRTQCQRVHAGIYAAPNPTANRNYTTRLNYDQTITPTLLLHIGHRLHSPVSADGLSQISTSLIWHERVFPDQPLPLDRRILRWQRGSANIAAGLENFVSGGFGGPNFGGSGPAFISFLWEEKPTANANLTWVHGNHIFKYGGELIVDGYPEQSGWRANGAFGISTMPKPPIPGRISSL